MDVTAGSHFGWFWKWSVATNRNTSAGGRSMTWDAASCTPLPPISPRPSPGADPTTGVLLAMASSSGCTRSTAVCGPPTMTRRSPPAARATPPDTGASTTTTCSASRPAQCWTAAGPTVAITRTTVPGARAAAAGSAPKSTSSTWPGVATIRTRTSAPEATTEIEAAGLTPSAARDAARPGSMS
jgi:hypothetical protein